MNSFFNNKLLKKSKQKIKKKSKENYKFSFGRHLLQSIETNILNLKHIEILKKIIKEQIGKLKPVWLRISLNHPVTTKKKNARMGKGKGDIKYYITKIKKGQVICEFDKISYLKIKKISEKINKKLPIKIRILL